MSISVSLIKDKLLFNILESRILYPLAATDWKNNIKVSLMSIGKEKKENIEKAVDKALVQYEKTFKLLGKE